MRDLEAPPLSAPMADFRAEVGRRASGLRRRRVTTGGALGALLVAGGLTAAGLTAMSHGDNRSAAPTAASTTQPGNNAAARPYGPAASGSSAGSSAGGAQRTTSAAPTTIPPAGPPWSLVGATTFSRPPSGSTLRVVVQTPVIVALAPPTRGSWGSARIAQGPSTVLALGGQSGDARGAVQVYLKGLSPGVVVLQVPCNGNPAATWYATLRVTGPSPQR